jgi:hypothetical protein
MEVQGHYNYLYEFRVYSSWLPYLQIARHRLLSQHHRFHNIHRSLIILHPRLAKCRKASAQRFPSHFIMHATHPARLT